MRTFLVFASIVVLAGAVSMQSNADTRETASASEENRALVHFSGEGTVTEGELLEYLDRLGTPPDRLIEEDPLLDTLPLHLGRITAKKILTASAESTGMAQDPDYLAEIKDIQREILARRLVNREFEIFLPVSESKARDYFDSHPDEFRQEPKVWFRHIFLPSDSIVDPQELVAELREGKLAFATAAIRYSTGASPDELDDVLGPVGRDALLPELEAVAFSIEPGTISDPICTKRGTEIIQVTQRQEELDFDTAKGKIENRIRTLRSEKYQEYLKQLRAKSALSQVAEILPHLQDREYEIARADAEVFTIRDLFAFVPRRTWSLDPQFSENELQGITREMMDRFLLAREAQSQGLGQDEESQQEYRESIAFHLRQMTFERYFKPRIAAMNPNLLDRPPSLKGAPNKPSEDAIMEGILELGGYQLDVQAAEQMRRRWLQQTLEN